MVTLTKLKPKQPKNWADAPVFVPVSTLIKFMIKTTSYLLQDGLIYIVLLKWEFTHCFNLF